MGGGQRERVCLIAETVSHGEDARQGRGRDMQRNPASSLDQEDGGLSHALPSLSRLPATAPGSPTSCLVHCVISFPSDIAPTPTPPPKAWVPAVPLSKLVSLAGAGRLPRLHHWHPRCDSKTKQKCRFPHGPRVRGLACRLWPERMRLGMEWPSPVYSWDTVEGGPLHLNSGPSMMHPLGTSVWAFGGSHIGPATGSVGVAGN